jgi:type VI secretion system secreted protein VgrG
MALDLLAVLRALLTDTTRLYRLAGEGDLSGLLVEAWRQHEALDTPWLMQIDALSPSAHLDVSSMLGRPLVLYTRLADGTEQPRSGIVTAAQASDADGALARYRLTVEPALGLLSRSNSSRVWQEKSVIDIVEDLLAACPHLAWHWADCVQPHLQASAGGGLRSYTVQHRQTDLAFLHQLLAREGLAYRTEEHAKSPLGHRVVFFADSANKTSCPEDTSSRSVLGGRGIRYHRAGSTEAQDAIQALGSVRRLPSAQTAVLSWDYKTKSAVAAVVPTAAAYGGPAAPALEAYASHAHHASYAWPDSAQAQRAATLVQESLEARHKTWLGRSTVRSFTAGTHFTLTQSDIADAGGACGAEQPAQRAVRADCQDTGQATGRR